MSDIESQVGDRTRADRLEEIRFGCSELFRTAARGVLLGMLALAPWPYGSVGLDVQQWLAAALLIALLLWLVATCHDALRRVSTGIDLPLMALPLTLFLALGAVQLVPIGHQEFWQDRNLPIADGNALNGLSARNHREPFVRSTFSLDPASTRLEMARATLACLACFLGVVLFRKSRHQIWLWSVLACNGAALSFLGIARRTSLQTDLFSSLANGHVSSFATFVNRNNAAGYLNLCLAAAIGLLFWIRHRSHAHETRKNADSDWPGRRARFQQLIAERLNRLEARQLWALVLAALILAGVLCTLSRGGILAAAIAGIVIVVAGCQFERRYVLTGSLAGLVVLCGFLVAWTETGSTITSRLWTLTDARLLENPRVAHWAEALGVVGEFPVLGTGLGTYRHVYLPYQERAVQTWFYHAENQYLQILVEAGGTGFLLALSLAAAVLAAIHFLLHTSQSAEASVVGLAGLFAVVAQGLHAFTDFGLWLPANFLTLSVILGTVTGTAAERSTRAADRRRLALPHWHSRWMSVAAAGVLCFSSVAAFREMALAADVEAVLKSTQVPSSPGTTTVDAIDEMISRVDPTVRRRPDDSRLRVRMAELWIQRYRLQALELLSETVEPEPAGVEASVWNLTSLSVAHQRANALFNAGEVQAFEAFRKDRVVLDNLVPALEQLETARAVCPVHPDVDLKLAALAFVRDPRSPDGLEWVHRAVALAPGNAELLFQAGGLALNAGDAKWGYRYWRKGLEMAPHRSGEILEFLSGRLSFETIARHVFPRSPEFLVTLIKERFAGEEHAVERGILVREIQTALRSDGRRWEPSERHYFRAVCHRYENRPHKAIEAYRAAITLRPLQVEWRFELAQLLHEQGRIEDALTEARLCQSLAPQRQEVRRWVQARQRERGLVL